MSSIHETTLECCANCIHYDEEWSEWDHQTYACCMLGVFFPIKKQSCKRQQPYSKEHDPFLKLETKPLL